MLAIHALCLQITSNNESLIDVMKLPTNAQLTFRSTRPSVSPFAMLALGWKTWKAIYPRHLSHTRKNGKMDVRVQSHDLDDDVAFYDLFLYLGH